MSQTEHTAGRLMLRKLDAIEEATEAQGGYTGSSRWMVPYADLLTLLLGLFLILFSLSSQHNQALNAQTRQMQTDLSQQEQQLQARDAELKHLKESMHALAAAVNVSDASAQAPQLIEKTLIQKLGVRQGVAIRQDERGVIVSLSDRLFFAPGSAALSPPAVETLQRLADVLKALDRPLSIEGHTDNTPIATRVYPSNWELSTARSTAIVRFLVTRLGFSPRQLSAAGYGEYRPVADNSSIEGKQKNRRVDIVILNRSARLATASAASNQSRPGIAPQPGGRPEPTAP